MELIHTAEALRAAIQSRRARGQSIGFVPTMGNLHDGHASLVERARAAADCVVVSIFVNPLQFGPGEDFERYPRTLEADARLLDAKGADLVFAPGAQEVYPLGFPPATCVQLDGGIVEQLEGVFRPGHFKGVATVVTILLNLLQPDLAVFGEKDYQQLALVRRMVRELAMPVRILGAPTLREADGLAMSSRNQYLRPEERPRAAAVFASLQKVASQLRAGNRDFAALERTGMEYLREAGLSPQYLAVRSPDLASPQEGSQIFVILVAALLGNTRLIDNLSVKLTV